MPKKIKYPPQNKSKFSYLSILAMIAITLPVGVYFISQQNVNLTDQRNRAGNDSYLKCDTRLNTCTTGYTCQCVDGPNCTKTACLPDNSRETRCVNDGGILCPGGRGRNTYVCCTGGQTCYPRGLPGCKP